MNVADLTSGQWRTVVAMAVVVVLAFAIVAGFIVTSLQGWGELPPTAANVPTIQSPISSPTPWPSPTFAATPDVGIQSQVQAARLFDQIAYQVETLRDLSPRAEVPLSFIDDREMTVLLRRLHARRELETLLSPYTELEVLPNVPVYVRPHQTVGIYVLEQQQLYVVAGQQESTPDDQALLAHAYVHALQDQHFDLDAMDARASSTDAALAIQALVEGDAALLTALYRYGDLSVTDWEHLLDLVLQAEQPDYGEQLEEVAAWRRLKRFPYWEGRLFVEAILQAGGWGGVNQAYANPPRSTEQVLHPERYLDRTDRVARVVVPDLGEVLGDAWELSMQDTLGELVIGLYLSDSLPEEASWQAADGWDGDTLVVWEQEGDEEGRILVWRTIWDNSSDAAQFGQALKTVVTQRYVPAWPMDPPGGLGGQWWETEVGAMYVGRVARYVTFVQAPNAGRLTNVVEVLP